MAWNRFAGVAWLIASLPALAAPPRVIEATPDNGAIGVDPATTEIRIVFDQPMHPGGRSIVGGGETFPEFTGQPRWDSPTTMVIRVRLKSGHRYWLSINNERFRNFTNAAGEPAVPYPISFQTAEAGGAGGAALTPEQNRAAVDALLTALTTGYSYRDRLGIDWAGLIGEHREALAGAATPAAFAAAAGTLLAKAEDKHTWLEAGGGRFGSFVRPQVPNVNPAMLPALVPGYERLSPVVAIGRWDDGIGYIGIDGWEAGQREAVEAAFEALWRLHDARAIVVDVRLNGGGDEELAKAFAGCFVDEPVLYARHRFVDPMAGGAMGAVRERRLEPSTRRPRFTGPVAVLAGPVCMSSNEAFVLMAKASPRVTVVGARTQGSSGSPKAHDLGNGVTLWLPSWQAMTPEGEAFEGVGIAPDIEVGVSPVELARGDPVLERALRVLREDR